MKMYVVMREADYCPSTVAGVYTTLEAARFAADKVDEAGGKVSGGAIYEVEVDAPARTSSLNDWRAVS